LEQEVLLNKEQLSVWTELVGKGIANAMQGLSQMTGEDINVSSLAIRQLPANEVPDLFGGAGTAVVGIYLVVSGDADGHIVLVYQPETAFALIDLLLGNPLGSTRGLDEMEESALGEMGNITGTFFLNSLSDNLGLSLRPSPPMVVVDMIGAILDVPLASIMQRFDEVSVVEAMFGTHDRQVAGRFMVVPTVELLDLLLKRNEVR